MTSKYEIHITVNPNQATHFKQFCQDNNLKYLSIELDRGDYVFQPMISYLFEGTESEVKNKSQELSQLLISAGFEVLRSKLEADLQNLPKNYYLTDKQYFEVHYKIDCSDLKMDKIRDFCSNNFLHIAKTSQNHGLTRLITGRFYNMSLETAQTSMLEIDNKLQSNNFKVLKEIRELVIYDSRLELDNGW